MGNGLDWFYCFRSLGDDFADNVNVDDLSVEHVIVTHNSLL